MSDYKVKKADAEWRAQLDPMQYEVARHAATERAFTGKYWDHWDPGQYKCIGCGTPLFESDTKFDAGCGWPSYFQPVNSEVIERVVDTALQQLRLAPWPRLRGRAGPDRRAFLHQLGSDKLRAAKEVIREGRAPRLIQGS
jgi:hypothetical protein